MRVLDFKDFIIKKHCPICGSKFKPFDGLMFHCNEEHFNGYDLSFGVKDSKIEYFYFDLNRPAHENSRKHYFFCSFQMGFMLFANVKASGGSKADDYCDLPFVNIDLSKIPSKKYKDYFKTFVVFQ